MVIKHSILEYNTAREPLMMKEYGRHIQHMVDYLLTIEDKETRQKNANTIIELMIFLNPHLKSVEDYKHKLWDHLFLISDFQLDVDSPYPIPTKEEMRAQPEPMPYPKSYPKFNHLGKNIEKIIEKALAETDPDKKQEFANAIAYYMKLTYSNWHKELVHDDNIQNELSAITGGELSFNNKPFVKHRKEVEFTSNGRNQFRRGGFNNNRGNNNNNQGGNNRNRQQGGNNNRNNNNNRNFKKRF